MEGRGAWKRKVLEVILKGKEGTTMNTRVWQAGPALAWTAAAVLGVMGMAGWVWGADGAKEKATDWQKEMDGKLREPITVAFEGTELSKALDYFRERMKVNIILDLDPGAGRRTPDMPRVTLRLAGVQGESALAWTVRLAGLTYVVKDQAIYVAPETKIDPEWRQEMRARYDRRMSDLEMGWILRVEEKMKSKIDVAFKNDVVDRAAEYVATNSGLNIVVDAESAKTAHPVNYEATQMSVENAIKWVSKLSGLHYTVRDEVVYIANQRNMAKLQLETGMAGVPPKFLQTVTFDFKDLELSKAMEQLKRQTGVNIEMGQGPGPERKVTVSGVKMELDKAVRKVLDNTGLVYAIAYRGDAMVVILRAPVVKKTPEGTK